MGHNEQFAVPIRKDGDNLTAYTMPPVRRLMSHLTIFGNV